MGPTKIKAMTEDEGLKMSPLCRTVNCEGKELEIFIFEDGEGGWLLEVVNEQGTSTAWTEPFKTDKAALKEALKTIKEEGLEGFKMEQPYKRELH